MDRFIGKLAQPTPRTSATLKSNMDRFIGRTMEQKEICTNL